MQHQVQEQLKPPLHHLAGAEAVITAALHIEPAQHRPPEAGIHGGDASDRTLAVVRHQDPSFLHETGGEHSPGLVGVALKLQADLQEMPHDREASLQQQVEHHRHVVSQEHLAVIGALAQAGMHQRRHRANGAPADGHQGAFEMLTGHGYNSVLPGIGPYPPEFLAELLRHHFTDRSPLWTFGKPSHGQWSSWPLRRMCVGPRPYLPPHGPKP